MRIPIIDLFAGPGGLGEGFSALKRGGKPIFKIGLSIEKDSYAHQTLELRAFFRQFPYRHAPPEYYQRLAGEISHDELFAKFPAKADAARREAWHAELGSKKYPDYVIDDRINTAIGDTDNWVLIGGPPCQAYSLVGRSRRKNDPTFATDEKHLLYQQYLRILAVHRPKVFVMENVKGMLSATVNDAGIFEKIRNDLTEPLKVVPEADRNQPLGYKLFSLVSARDELQNEIPPEDFIVRAEDYGLPQARHRVILLGIRTPCMHSPGTLRRVGKTIPIQKAINDLPRLRSGLSKEDDDSINWLTAVQALSKSTALLEGAILPELRKAILRTLKIIKSNLSRGGEFVGGKPAPNYARNWLRDCRLHGFCNHATRGHIRDDLHRYLFAANFARIYHRTPGLEEFPKSLLPKHENVAKAIAGTMFNDRFRVQSRGRPSTTITSHISKDGHYFIHYDPTQCRSLTVREAARLQTFPDNYFFEGPRTAQYQQVGNAVPPLLAYQIAKIVHKIFKQ